jgi:hypothetical protein
VKRLYRDIKPVIIVEGVLHYIKDVDPWETSFVWDPTPTKPAENLGILTIITTFHSFGAPAIFKPGIAEVLAQIPKSLLNEVVAFRTLSDLTPSNILNTIPPYHFAHTILYKRDYKHNFSVNNIIFDF